MHYIYRKTEQADNKWRFSLTQEVALFGCNSGVICQILSDSMRREPIKPSDNAYLWDIDVRSGLTDLKFPGSALIINLKPRSAEGNISLYELIHVWGWSENAWTTLLLHFRGLLIDQMVGSIDVNDFTIDEGKVDDPIFSLTYRHGSIQGGSKLVGKWTSSGPSAANSVLLWPKPFEYFVSKAKAIIDSKLK